jgi:hypothetical protein
MLLKKNKFLPIYHQTFHILATVIHHVRIQDIKPSEVHKIHQKEQYVKENKDLVLALKYDYVQTNSHKISEAFLSQLTK